MCKSRWRTHETWWKGRIKEGSRKNDYEYKDECEDECGKLKEKKQVKVPVEAN